MRTFIWAAVALLFVQIISACIRLMRESEDDPARAMLVFTGDLLVYVAMMGWGVYLLGRSAGL